MKHAGSLTSPWSPPPSLLYTDLAVCLKNVLLELEVDITAQGLGRQCITAAREAKLLHYLGETSMKTGKLQKHTRREKERPIKLLPFPELFHLIEPAGVAYGAPQLRSCHI